MSRPAAFFTHLLYLDDSGSVQNASDKHIVLAGFSAFERCPHWLTQSLDKVAAAVWPENPLGLEFRGADIVGGKKHWQGVSKDVRHVAFCRALRLLTTNRDVRLFGAVVVKSAVSPDDPMEIAFEHIASRFDRMLGRLHKGGDTQRGLIVLDESSYETSLQGLAQTFRTEGHKWGRLYNLTDVPLFVNSRATRMIQLADLVAFAVRRHFERGDSVYFDLIRDAFDVAGGVTHGLVYHDGEGAAPSSDRQVTAT